MAAPMRPSYPISTPTRGAKAKAKAEPDADDKPAKKGMPAYKKGSYKVPKGKGKA